MPKSENNQQILKKRALTLAEKPSDRTANKDLMEVVEFLLAEERYAIESSYISEVYPLRDLTTLPGTPPFVRGIINLRGKILSIIDLRIFFALPETGLSDLNKVIVLHNRNMEFGILADTVLGARSILRGSLLPALPTLTEIRADYLKGVTEQRLVVLDADRLLNNPSIQIRQEVQ